MVYIVVQKHCKFALQLFTKKKVYRHEFICKTYMCNADASEKNIENHIVLQKIAHKNCVHWAKQYMWWNCD